MAVKFTEKAEKVLLAAGSEAKQRVHEYVGTEHILHALLTQPDSIAIQAVVRSCEASLDEVERLVDDVLAQTPTSTSPCSSALTPSAAIAAISVTHHVLHDALFPAMRAITP